MNWDALAPVAKAVGPALGATALSWILNRMSGDPYRQQYEQLLTQQQPMLNILQQQAMGMETPATQFITGRIQQAGRGRQLTAAASATRQQVGRQAAAGAQSRIGQETQQITADALAQLQMGAQQQYGGLLQQIMQGQGGLAKVEMEAQGRLSANLGILADLVRKGLERGDRDEWLEQMQDIFADIAQPEDEKSKRYWRDLWKDYNDSDLMR